MQVDAAAFKQFYQKYYHYVFSIVIKYIPSKEDAEDIISEVFLSLYKLFDQIDNKANVKALVFTITKRRVNDYLRKKYHLANYLNDAVDVNLIAELEDPTAINHEEQVNLVQKLITVLKPKYQQLYKLKYQLKLTNSKTGEKMGLSENYVKVLNNRLIKQLKQLWIKKNNNQI